MVSPQDFLTFALDMVAAEMGINREILRPIERKIRHDQGGDQHYIASAAALEIADRHAAIRAAVAAGATASAAAARFGISRQHVYRIIPDRSAFSKSRSSM